MAVSATINVRLDKELKTAGDATLAQEGLSPTKIVRALWRRLANRGEPLDQLLSILFDEADANQGQSTLGLVEQGWALADGLFHTLGVDKESVTSRDDEAGAWDELYAQAMDAHFSERGLYQ